MTEAQYSALTGKPAPAANDEKLSRSKAVALKFAEQCERLRLPTPVRELAFAKCIGRKWRFDFAWPELGIAVEIEGLVVYRGWVAKLDGKEPVRQGGRVTNVTDVESRMLVMGRHATIGGFEEDAEKYAEAAILGWRVLRFSQNQVLKRYAIDFVARAIAVLPPCPIAVELKPEQAAFALPAPMAARPF